MARRRKGRGKKPPITAQESNPGPPAWESAMLTTQKTIIIIFNSISNIGIIGGIQTHPSLLRTPIEMWILHCHSVMDCVESVVSSSSRGSIKIVFKVPAWQTIREESDIKKILFQINSTESALLVVHVGTSTFCRFKSAVGVSISPFFTLFSFRLQLYMNCIQVLHYLSYIV